MPFRVSLPLERLRETLETHLMSQGIYVTDCARQADALHIGYETMAPGDGVPRTEVGQLLNALLDLAGIETPERDSMAGFDDSGAWEPEDVTIWVFEGTEESTEDLPSASVTGGDGPGDVGETSSGTEDAGASTRGQGPERVRRGRFKVREGWFRALDAGDISETDFSTLVLSTVESTG